MLTDGVCIFLTLWWCFTIWFWSFSRPVLSALAVTLLPPLVNTFFMIIFFPEIAAMKTLQQCNIKLFMFFEFLEVLTFWLVTNLQTVGEKI